MIHLTNGAHDRRDQGMCAMEAAAYIAGERHTDHPICVSPVIAAFMRRWNDSLPTDADRDRLLKPLLPVILHTASCPQDDETRAWLATDWLVRVQTPAWLDLARLTERATDLRNLPPLNSGEIALAVQGVIEHARRDAAAAWDAAGDAAGDAARAAARAAAWDAAWAAARAAAGDAARAAAGAAARAAARAAAGAAAWAAAGDAARAAARAAAGAAAGAALAPTVETLQASAQDLMRRMAVVGVVIERQMIGSRLHEVCETC